jgi:polyphosphate kinase 2 (PPK2 family)
VWPEEVQVQKMADEVAFNCYALLLVYQGMNSACKDGAIRRVTGTEA